MRSLVFLATALAVMGLAFWAYRENYRTQSALSEMSRLRSEITALRDGLGVLNAEWAYLNRPERLRELAMLNFERLALLPLEPGQFADVAQVAFPPEPEPFFEEADPFENTGGPPGAEGMIGAVPASARAEELVP